MVFFCMNVHKFDLTQSLCARSELDVQVPIGLRGIRKHGSDLWMLGAECLRYIFGSVCICFASGLFSIFEYAVEHTCTCALHKHESYM
jgi:hypothetical protein